MAIDAILAAERPLRLKVWTVATSWSHVHPLVGWRDERTPAVVRRSLKRSVSLELKAAGERMPFLAGGGNLRRVLNEKGFAFFREEYLPDHPGWLWDHVEDWRGPRRAERDRAVDTASVDGG